MEPPPDTKDKTEGAMLQEEEKNDKPSTKPEADTEQADTMQVEIPDSGTEASSSMVVCHTLEGG